MKSLSEEKVVGPTDEQFGDAVERQVADKPKHDSITPEPEEELSGDEVLNAVEVFLNRFCIHPTEHALVAHVLWVGHAHLMNVWDSTPRLCFLSPEPASGKTRCLEVTELLVPNAVEAINVSPAYLFRKVGEGECTILFDEIDTVFGPKAKENEEIRGLLNAGHRKGACAGRVVMHGKQAKTEEIPAYCAVALAGLGWLPDTIMSRAVIIRMRRRLPSETVEPFRRRIHAAAGHRLRVQLARWAAQVGPSIKWPVMPPGIEDRDADVWEALIAVADAAGGDWPRLAREAAKALVAEGKDREPSLGIRLLADLRTVFGDEEQMTTEAILHALNRMPEAPWGDLKGRPLDQRGLARQLRKYGVKPKVLRVGNATPRGYTRESLHDPWEAYLPRLSPERSATSATSATGGEKPGDFNWKDVADAEEAMRNRPATSATRPMDVADTVADVADYVAASATEYPSKINDVADVADVAHSSDGGGEDDLPIPSFLDRRNDPLCAYCGRPGGQQVACDGVVAVVHTECQRGWLSQLDQKLWATAGSSQ
jgi:hypothetical protein